MVRVALACPSYKGPHKDCFSDHNELFHYFGRLQERSYAGGGAAGAPPLDRMQALPLAELQPGDPIFEFMAITHTGNSLIGAARDDIVQRAKDGGADYVLFYDDDMIFGRDAFLRLWRHQKPFVGALAFTAREPIAPVIYEFDRDWNFKRSRENFDVIVRFDYPRDQLFQVDAIGAGVVLIDMDVFRRLERPWFDGAICAGEDIHLCWKMFMDGIPVYCDSSVKTLHVPNVASVWHDEGYYLSKCKETEAWYRANRPSHRKRARLA